MESITFSVAKRANTSGFFLKIEKRSYTQREKPCGSSPHRLSVLTCNWICRYGFSKILCIPIPGGFTGYHLHMRYLSGECAGASMEMARILVSYSADRVYSYGGNNSNLESGIVVL